MLSSTENRRRRIVASDKEETMTQKQNKGTDYSGLIIWAAVIIGSLRYSAAFMAADLGKITGPLSDAVTFMLTISGVAMGVLGSLGTAYLFDGWRQKIPAAGSKWSNKFKALTAFVALSFITELLILVPFTESRVKDVSMADVLQGGVWWWSMAVVAMPIILIGGVSLGNQVVTVEVTGQSGQMSASPSKPDEKTSESDRTDIDGDWRIAVKKLTPEQIKKIAFGKTSDICYEFGITDRQARRWRRKAQAKLEEISS